MTSPLSINPNRIGLDEAYMQMAEIWAKRSKANRKQVGALLVRDKQIISDGYNGIPAGAKDDVCEYLEDGVLKSKRDVLHAESNALMKISRHGGTGCDGATMYVTMSPCFECSKLMIQAKIARVVYREAYRDMSGVDNLIENGIQVDQI